MHFPMNRFRCLLVLVVCLSTVPTLRAQDYFEGTFVFSVDISGPVAEMLQLNEPNDKMVMHVRESDYIVLLQGGRYPKTFLFIADSNYEYSIDQANERAYRFSMHVDESRETHQLEQQYDLQASPTGDSAVVKGVTCQIYRLRKPEAVFYYYVSDAYRVNTDLYPENPRSKASFLAPGLEGRIPLKTVRKEQDFTVTTTVTNINPRQFNPGQFIVPPGYEVKMRDYRY